MAYYRGVDLNAASTDTALSLANDQLKTDKGGGLMGFAASAGGGALIGAGVGLVGDIIGLAMNWKAQQRQIKENKRVETLNLNLREQDRRDAATNRAEDVGFREKNFKLDKEKFAYQKQLDTYTKLQKMLDGIAGQMNRDPQFGMALQTMWRR